MNVKHVALASAMALSSIVGIGASVYASKNAEKAYEYAINQDTQDEIYYKDLDNCSKRQNYANMLVALSILSALTSYKTYDNLTKKDKT